jgi:2-succinyl-6-hydroxy-2,4-cyclohexadiene-1-carboxylate synthase
MHQLQSYNWLGERLQIHYHAAGDPDRSCLLFLHGFVGTGRDWQSVISHLSGLYYCIAPDLPGHGKTILNADARSADWPLLVDNLADFVKFLNKKNIVMIGYSMGGRLALHLALNYPVFFKGLVLESASPGLKTAQERQKRIQEDEIIARELERTPFEQFLRKWYRQPVFHSLNQHKDYQKLINRRLAADPEQLAAALRLLSTGKQPSLWTDLVKIKLPLFLLAGERDLKFSLLMSEMQQLCPHAELQLVKQAGHNIHFEKPLVFLQYISNFLSQIQETL